MPIFRQLFKKVLRLNNWSLLIACFVVFFGSSVVVYVLEPQTFTSLFHAFWWVMVTSTTVGYGDVYPHTTGGRLVGIFLFIFGIGLLGVVIGKVVDAFGAYRKKREEGRLSYKGEDHILIVGWSQKAVHAVEEILASNPDVDVVIIDTLDKAPALQERVHYVQGEAAEEETLEQANLAKAKSVLIFADDKTSEPQISDGKALLIATTIERIAPKVHSVVELMDERYIKNFHFVNVNEFILMHETISRLAVRSAFMGGISEVYRQLMSRQKGDNLYRVAKRPHWKTYRDAFEELLKEGATLVADRSDLTINRRLDEQIPDEAKLYVICDGTTYKEVLKQTT